jgi:hypothetical protein
MATTTKKVSVKAADKLRNPAGVLKSARVSEEDIRFHAYEIFQARAGNGLAGNAMSDWLQAERELVNQVFTVRTKRTTRV